jgi:phenylacetate-CoA ligase
MFDHLRRSGVILDLERRDRLFPGAVRARQERMLRRIVAHAHRHVPYYRALLDGAGLLPGDVGSLDRLWSFPASTKKDVRKAPAESLLSSAVRGDRLKTFRTTGSTGVPLLVRRTKAEDLLFHLFRMRAIRAYGLRARDRVVRVRSGNAAYVPLSWRLSRALGLFRQDMVDTADTPQANADALLAMKPDVVTGYNSSLDRIARVITLERHTALPLRFAVGGADMLTPLLRKHIRAAFGGPVYDTYECVEVGMMAWECPGTGLYHVCDDNVILEVLKDGRPALEGERGEVVVTSLHLRAMPFIRYRLEDIVTAGPDRCPCGLPFRTLRAIDAKRQDYFRLPDGREIYPWAISLYLMDHAPWILQYELVQEREDRIVLRAEALPEPSAAHLERLREGLRPLLGPDVAFDVDIVRELVPTPGGKFWPRRSLVRTVYDDIDPPGAGKRSTT